MVGEGDVTADGTANPGMEAGKFLLSKEAEKLRKRNLRNRFALLGVLAARSLALGLSLRETPRSKVSKALPVQRFRKRGELTSGRNGSSVDRGCQT